MSTISQTPKVNTVRNFNSRNLNLLVVAALVVALVAIFTGAMASRAVKAVDHSAYMLYRQGEWLSVPIRLSNAESYQIFRRSEVASPLSNAEAYQLFHLGEWASVNIPLVDLTAYHFSERTLVDAKSGIAIYLLSEHGHVDPAAGMATYLKSERTSVPVRFTPYQRSEWFGK